MTSEDEIIRRLLETQYADAMSPQGLKSSIMGTIELITTLKELALLYTVVPLRLIGQHKTGGGER